MSLENVYDAMCAYVTGTAAEECQPVHMFGNMSAKDARRLAVYRNNYRGGLADNLRKLFPVTSKVINTRFGHPAWERFVDEVAKRGPLPNLRLGGAVLVDVLAGPVTAELGLPPWISELANVEVTQRRIFLAPDEVLPEGLTVNPVLALLECRYDVMRVRSASDPTTVDPELSPNVIGIWRTSEGERRTRVLGPVELAILRYVQKEHAIRPQEIADSCAEPTTAEDVRRQIPRLVRIELLSGVKPGGPRTRTFDGRLCTTTSSDESKNEPNEKGTTP
jgi:hypothetical protein